MNLEYRIMLRVPEDDNGKWDFDSAEWFDLKRVKHLYCVGVEIEVPMPSMVKKN